MRVKEKNGKACTCPGCTVCSLVLGGNHLSPTVRWGLRVCPASGGCFPLFPSAATNQSPATGPTDVASSFLEVLNAEAPVSTAGKE